METSEKKKYKTRDVLLVASYFTKCEGYHPVADGRNSTRERVLSYLRNNIEEDLSEYQPRAEAAVQWVKNEKSSDWVDNIRSYMTKREVEENAVGILSSVFAGYDNYLKKQESRKELLKSEYQGKPKENITIDVKSTRHISSGKSKYNEDKEFHIHQIIDKSNNVYIWFSDRDYTDDLANAKLLGAMVKSHNERDGVKQTIIQVNDIQ